jgi:peptide/nickel transport system substrate-binding protein
VIEFLRVRGLLAIVAGIVVVATACGDSSSSSDADEGSQGPPTRQSQTVEPEGDPIPGGSVVFGLEAETDGWDPTTNRWAPAGVLVGGTIFDPLAAWTVDGDWAPFLAESFEPDETFENWTITLRPDITFHNGDSLTSEALEILFNAHLASPLTSPAFRPLESVEIVDDLTLMAKMNSPWSSFPVSLTAQAGMVPAPAQLASDSNTLEPIGTGPFVFDQWIPDGEFTASKNPDYWREGLPYLDDIEFRPIVDNDARSNSIRSGQLDMLNSASAKLVSSFRDEADNGEMQLVEDGAVGEETFILFNTLVPPLDDLRVRQAVAMATNREAYITVIADDLVPPAASPYIEGSQWYSEEAADLFPTFDVEGAKALVEEYEAEVGPIEFELTTTPVPANVAGTTFLQEQWAAVGIDVELNTAEQAQFILNGVSGEFEANLWRHFGSPDPSRDEVWWVCNSANPIGEFSLNFARNCNPETDAALLAGRSTDVFEERYEAFSEAQVLINEDLPYSWINHSIWAIIADNDIRNVATATLPDGSPRLGLLNGVISMAEVWTVDQ